jgi:hypothetical protein
MPTRYEPGRTGLCATGHFTDFPPHSLMAPTTPSLDDWHPQKGFEIATKHKEAIRQLHWYGKVSVCALQMRYRDPITKKPLGESTIRKILGYTHPQGATLIERTLHSFYRIEK